MKTYWLASYPKSGNTWFRIFLSNLLYPENSPVDPNRLPLNNLISSARSPFHEIIGVPASLLSPDECDALRPDVDQIIARDWEKPICVRKAHDAYTYLSDGRPLMGNRPDFSAIYILRNPWDIAVSAANHWGTTISRSVEMMCTDNNALDNRKDRISSQLRQRLRSWSGHVESWLKAPLDLCLIRYEEMHNRPLEVFRSATDFLGLRVSDREIEDAIGASSFEHLERFERERGFREAPGGRRFFRKGQVGNGRDRLSNDDQQRLDRENEIVQGLLRARSPSSP